MYRATWFDARHPKTETIVFDAFEISAHFGFNWISISFLRKDFPRPKGCKRTPVMISKHQAIARPDFGKNISTTKHARWKKLRVISALANPNHSQHGCCDHSPTKTKKDVFSSKSFRNHVWHVFWCSFVVSIPLLWLCYSNLLSVSNHWSDLHMEPNGQDMPGQNCLWIAVDPAHFKSSCHLLAKFQHLQIILVSRISLANIPYQCHRTQELYKPFVCLSKDRNQNAQNASFPRSPSNFWNYVNPTSKR